MFSESKLIELIRAIVEAAGGSMEVASTKVASKLVIELQRRHVAGSDSDAAPAPSASVNEEHQLPRVLHVEDADRAGDLIHYYLRGLYAVDTVMHAEAALKHLMETQYDVILMDMELGDGLSGLELTHIIRRLPEYVSTPIIAITAHSGRGDEQKCMEAGCNAFLAKPFLKEDVIRLISRLVPDASR